MKRIKKAVAVTVVTAILAASGDMTSVLAREEAVVEVAVSQGESGTESDFVIKKGVLKKYNGTDTEVVVPDGVKKIGMSAFENCSSLTGITLPESLKYIDWYAFQGCTNLTEIKIPV